MDLKPTRPARGIAALDRLAERLTGATELRLAVADSPAELIAVHRLRYRDVTERGLAQPGEHPDGLERDAYDARALQVCAWDGDVLAGTVRLVLPVPGKRLPTEEAFDLTVESAGEVVDIGRVLVSPRLGADAAQRAWGGLFAQAWFETRARGYTGMTSAASAPRIERYRALGVVFDILGPARPEGDLHPVRLVAAI
jgi:hypothetical protein